ncbi:MAG: beta-lactamase family protein [Bacteroidales bacterium]|jgi:CubicO group peptidase (beta-lactamase class C family)|nr:beta-lactamase family protein [Bacteroidales bacterium]
MRKVLILSLIACLIGFEGYSQNIDKTKLDAYFDTLAKNDKFMGSVAVSHNGELIYTKSVGFSDIEKGLKANEDTKYKIASISKTFTAVLIFIAIDEGILNPDQTIDKFFPEINNAEKITISHLLYHRSGIFDDNSYTDYTNQPETTQETLERITNAQTDFEPGTKARYGNVNFILLSYILEKIYQKSFPEILEEKITKPTGLKNTYCVNNVNNDACKSYKYVWEIEHGNNEYSWESEPEIDLSVLLGAVGIASNAVDLVLFSDALFNGKLISDHSLQQMETIKDGYGMGLMQIPFGNRTGFGHSGNIDAFSSIFVHFPDSKVSFALTANGLNYNRDHIAYVVLSTVYNMSFEIPEFGSLAYNLTDDELEQYVGIYSNEQISGKITVIRINNQLFGAMTDSYVPLKAVGKNKFVFEDEGIVLEFNPVNRSMIFMQGGQTVSLIRVSNPEFNTTLTNEDLDKYLGVYLSEQITIKITIIKAYHKLFAHVTGRNSLMLLETTEKDKFEFAEEGIILEFNQNNKTLVVKQGNRILSFIRKD